MLSRLKLKKVLIFKLRGSFSMFSQLRFKNDDFRVPEANFLGSRGSCSKLTMFELQRFIFDVFEAQAQK